MEALTSSCDICDFQACSASFNNCSALQLGLLIVSHEIVYSPLSVKDAGTQSAFLAALWCKLWLVTLKKIVRGRNDKLPPGTCLWQDADVVAVARQSLSQCRMQCTSYWAGMDPAQIYLFTALSQFLN